MAEKQQQALGYTQDELDEKAFDLYKETAAKSATGRVGEKHARASYAKAEAFLAVRQMVRSGELKTKHEGPALTDCCAPNLHRSHPHNLVSQRFGNLGKVERIAQWLNKNPTPERNPEELVARLTNEFPELSWDEAAVNTARAIFPAYVSN